MISNAPSAWSGRFLSLTEREDIMTALAEGLNDLQIARRLGRLCSTIKWEIDRNSIGEGYRASTAQHLAEQRAKRLKPAKLAGRP